MAGKIKVSPNGKLYFSRVVRNGRVQRAFRQQIGIPVGQCVAAGIPRGSHNGRRRNLQVIRDCVRQHVGPKGQMHLNLGAYSSVYEMEGPSQGMRYNPNLY
jgi:hypothetical protein